MRLSERIMAGVLACTLTMCVLTACGGGGNGSSVSATAAFDKLTKQLAGGTYYAELEATFISNVSGVETDKVTEVIASNGTMDYTKDTFSDGTSIETWQDENYIYTIDEKEKVIVKIPKDEESAGGLFDEIVSKELASAPRKTDTMTIDGTEYSCVIVTIQGEEVKIEEAFCFNKNGDLKYIVVDDIEGESMQIKVVKFETTVDESLFDFPEGYDGPVER